MKVPQFQAIFKISFGYEAKLRISYIDPDLTDSDSSSAETRPRRTRRVVRRVVMNHLLPPPNRPVRRFRGVIQRKCGRYCAEICDRTTRTRLWLGTFDTVTEAAVAYDRVAKMLSGNRAVNIFPQQLNGGDMGEVINPPSPPQPVVNEEQE